MRMIFILFSIFGLCSAAYGQEQTAGSEIPMPKAIIKANYLCERSVQLPVIFVNEVDGKSYAVAFIEGKLIAMQQGMSGSGARYIALDEQMSYRLHIKGNDATLSFMDADHEAEEQILLKACHTSENE